MCAQNRTVTDVITRSRQLAISRVTALAALVAAVVSLSSCGSGGNVNPTRTPTFTGLPSRSETRTPAASSSEASGTTHPESPETKTATRTQVITRSETRTQVISQPETRTQVISQPETQTVTKTRTAHAATSTSAKPAGTAAASETSDSTPAWVWWLIGAVALALIVTGIILMRRSRRRREWTEAFASAKDEAGWFGRGLMPQLEQAPTAAQIAGGWRMEASRVVALEDRLTTLEAGATDDAGRQQARALRDAVRSARSRLAALDTMTDTSAARDLLSWAALDVETALADGPPAGAGGRHEPGHRR